MSFRKLGVAVMLAAGMVASHAGGTLSFNGDLEWNGSATVASDGIAEDAFGDTDIYQSTLLGAFTVADVNQLTGVWSFSLTTAGTVDLVVWDGNLVGSNPGSVSASIDGGTGVSAPRTGSGLQRSYSFDFGSQVFSAGNHSLTLSNFNSFDVGPLTRTDVTLAVTAVPEPETYAMMLAGLGALGFLARRRKAQQG
jgi:hypothetical protein